jgi:multidrug/hemolysin transport system ATP-binding protein
VGKSFMSLTLDYLATLLTNQIKYLRYCYYEYMSSAITVAHLTKRYGTFTAVDDISFEVEKGSVFGFLGPNGAGKSTTIGCLTAVLQKDGGSVRINDHELGQNDIDIHRSIGVVFQNSLLDGQLTVQENLRIRASFYGVTDVDKRITTLAQLIDLQSFLSQRYGMLSGGQRRRVDIARALLHKPDILFLDEPTTGLDPQSREKVWETVYDLQSKIGLTVFLTTHYMEEAEHAAMVYVIDGGQIVAHDTPTGLRMQYSHDELRLTAKDMATLKRKLGLAHIAYAVDHDVLVVRPASGQEALQVLERYKSDLRDFEFRHGTMDDVFMYLTGRDIRGESEQRS